MPSKCDGCKLNIEPWSEANRKEWRGCRLLMTNENIAEESIPEIIKADEIGLGWVHSGGMAFNYQILTRNTRSCSEFKEK